MSLFGAPSTPGFGAPSATAAPSSFTFGSPGPSRPVTAGGQGTGTPGGLFGTSSTTPSMFGSTTPAAGTAGNTPSLFGASTTTAPSSSTSFTFGPTSGAAPAAGATSSLFGNAPSTTTPAAGTTSLFGTSGTAPSTPSMFGASTPSLFGASTQQQQQQQQQVTLSTPFSSLPKDYQETLFKVQKAISDQKTKAEELSQRSTSEIGKVRDLLFHLKERAATLANALQGDLQFIASFKKDVNKELKNAEFVSRTLERLKAPPSMMFTSQLTFSPPSPFFIELIHSFEQRMAQYNQLIDEIERFVSAANNTRPYSPKMLQDIMIHQHEIFISMAGQVAVIHDAVNELKEQFLDYRRKNLNDSRDIFEEADKKEKAKKLKEKQQAARPNLSGLPMVQAPAATPATPATPAPTTGTNLFGAPLTTTTPAPTTTTTPVATSLFGAPTATTTPATTAPATSLFGNVSTPAAPTTATPFGAPSTTAAPGGSLFGGPTPAAPASTTPSLFGAAPAASPAPATGGGLFGAASPAAGFGGFGSPTPSTPTTAPQNPNAKKGKPRTGGSSRR